jgi:hypothetical protein
MGSKVIVGWGSMECKDSNALVTTAKGDQNLG